jgi:4-diphosphocytidyl-2-C-methyl-D-erythritol kinase
MVSWATRWPAPAKLNLMLRIIGQREDGYHLLQTVFQFVDLSDWITFHPREGGVHLLKPIVGVVDTEELTVRAANLLKRETGCTQGVCIEIEKNLPMGGGLGGGSSDAATTLMALNKLWDLNLSTPRLLELGLQLGADVPVFVFGHASWAEGVGERLEQISVDERWAVVIKPDCHVNTKEIFSAKDLTRNSKSITMREFIAGDCRNDCLEAVCRRYQLVKEALNDLAKFSEARLTGTGACVFALFDSQELALNAYNQLRGCWQVYLTKTVNESPLMSMLKD